MKICYLANTAIPSSNASAIQIVKMCEAFSKLGYETNLFTINSKNERGVPVPSDFHITLFDTGQFYSTFVIIPGKDFFEIDANPIREESNLFEDFGEDILGLNDENLQILIDFFKETVVLRVKEQLRLL